MVVLDGEENYEEFKSRDDYMSYEESDKEDWMVSNVSGV